MERANRTKYAVLGILSLGAHSGYDVKKFCEEVLAYFWHESYGQIYPLLRTLEKEGLIRKEKRNDDKVERRVAYVITASGKKDLGQWLTRPIVEQAPRNELLLKVFFSNLVGPEVAIKQVEAYGIAQKQLQLVLKEVLANLESQSESEPQLVYWKLTVRLGLRLCTARIAWCDETIQELARLREGKL